MQRVHRGRVPTRLVVGGDSPALRLARVDPQGIVAQPSAIDITGATDAFAVVSTGSTIVASGNLALDATGQGGVWLVTLNDNLAATNQATYTHDGLRKAFGASHIKGSTDVLLYGGDELAPGATAWVARVTADGAEVWLDRFTTANLTLFANDALALEDGESLVSVVNGNNGLLRRYSADGTLVESIAGLGFAPVALSRNTDGIAIALGTDASVHRIAFGTFSLWQPNPERIDRPLTEFAGKSLMESKEGGFVVLASVQTEAPTSGAFLAHVDEAARSACGRAGPCAAPMANACFGEAPCSVGECDPSSGTCDTRALPDGTRCGDALSCNSGACEPAPEFVFPQALDANDCFGVASYAECVPGSLSYATVVLNADGTLETFDGTATGTWSQPTGPGSIEWVVENDANGPASITFTGTEVDAGCYEGPVASSDGLTGGFRACKN